MIRGDVVSEPLDVKVVHAVMKAGGLLGINLSSDDINEAYLRGVNEKQLQWVSPVSKLLFNEADVLIALHGVSNTRSMTNIDPTKKRARGIAYSELTETNMRRAADGELRWTTTQIPCAAYAQEADMSLSEYKDFVYAATYADQENPIAEWQRIHD